MLETLEFNTTMSLVGKIAQILDTSQFVITLGEKDGVRPQMRFVIYEEGAEIHHPDTGELLGKLEVVKGEVEVVHVQERMALVRTKAIPMSAGTSSVLSARLAETTRSDPGHVRHEELSVQRAQITGAPKPRPIQVGDFVRNLD